MRYQLTQVRNTLTSKFYADVILSFQHRLLHLQDSISNIPAAMLVDIVMFPNFSLSIILDDSHQKWPNPVLSLLVKGGADLTTKGRICVRASQSHGGYYPTLRRIRSTDVCRLRVKVTLLYHEWCHFYGSLLHFIDLWNFEMDIMIGWVMDLPTIFITFHWST